MSDAKQPVFGPNGVVLNSNDYEPWRKRTKLEPILDPLVRREPHLAYILLGIILAGPLNPSLLFWIPFGLITNNFTISAALWFVGLPSTLAAGFGATYIYRQEHNFASIVAIAFKLMGWTGLILASPSLLVVFAAPWILVPVALFVLIIGIPAALAGALVMRLVVFETSRAD